MSAIFLIRRHFTKQLVRILGNVRGEGRDSPITPTVLWNDMQEGKLSMEDEKYTYPFLNSLKAPALRLLGRPSDGRYELQISANLCKSSSSILTLVDKDSYALCKGWRPRDRDVHSCSISRTHQRCELKSEHEALRRK